ncbi:TPA: putative protein YneK [Escherichia coli]|nr:putative protein YneK [Escherichia coli]
MVTPVSISNYISLPDDFPVRNIAPQVKEVLKDFIDALSTIITYLFLMIFPYVILHRR